MRTVLTYSIFKGSYSGHGGEKRTQQIHDILSRRFSVIPFRSRFKYNSKEHAPFLSKLKGSQNILKVFEATRIYRHSFSVNRLLDESHKIRVQNNTLTANYDDVNKTDAVIWECNFPDFFYLPYLVKKRFGKKIIACPHNIESLVPSQTLRWYGGNKFHRMQQEFESLRLCDAVFTISEEDQWLLNLFDITARFLPYYPSGKLLDSLIQIRKDRIDTVTDPGSYFLLVGSVNNPPTRAGMIKVLSQLQELEKKNGTALRFKVAGYGTDNLAEFATDSVEVLGPVSESRLNELLRNCRALVINQGYSTGALTKVPEMLIAGIPVIVDEGSARSFRRHDGVHVYASQADLEDLLTMNIKMPEIPGEPSNCFQSFLDAV